MVFRFLFWTCKTLQGQTLVFLTCCWTVGMRPAKKPQSYLWRKQHISCTSNAAYFHLRSNTAGEKRLLQCIYDAYMQYWYLYKNNERKNLIFCQQKKSRRGFIELSRIRCAEIVKIGGETIPCANKYPFQVWFKIKFSWVS